VHFICNQVAAGLGVSSKTSQKPIWLLKMNPKNTFFPYMGKKYNKFIFKTITLSI